MSYKIKFIFVAILVLSLFAVTSAQDLSEVEISTTQVSDNIYMLQGAGGNIGICVGDDGVFMIDDQFAPLNEKIMAAVSAVSDKPVKFLLNTHWHGDHTGGNEPFGKSGSVIVAHDNVRKYLTEDQFIEFFNMTTPASSKDGLPVVTFSDAVTFHFNNEEIYAYHVEPSHTDGDAVVHFKNANVVHAGDIYFNGTYPFIDIDHGGSINGMIRVGKRLLDIIGDETKIISGHGNLGDKADFEKYIKMLTTIRDRVRSLVDEGKTFEEVLAAKPSAEFDETYSTFINAEGFLSIVYKDLSN
jgi:glyoxylase-like metal-dependent hydrolase (beta-lactamase superfamily II)